MLLAYDADVNHRGEHGETALMKAARNRHQKIVKLLLSQDADVDLQDYKGWTALMEAARRGQAEIVRLRNNTDQTIKNSFGKTAEQYVLDNGHADVVSLLIQNRGRRG